MIGKALASVVFVASDVRLSQRRSEEYNPVEVPVSSSYVIVRTALLIWPYTVMNIFATYEKKAMHGIM